MNDAFSFDIDTFWPESQTRVAKFGCVRRKFYYTGSLFNG